MIKDNESASEIVQMFFLNEGWEATFKDDGKEGLAIFLASPKKRDMITLDSDLSSMGGTTVRHEIRKVSANVSTIILTVRDSGNNRVTGLEVDVDDYATKPFSPSTLVARMEALHRRVEVAEAAYDTSENTDEVFNVIMDHFKMNTKTRGTYLDNQLIEGSTPKESDLLYTLAKKPRQVFLCEQLLEPAWDYQYFGDEQTVDAHIKKLRQKIKKAGPQVIQTVWDAGHKFDDSGVA